MEWVEHKIETSDWYDFGEWIKIVRTPFNKVHLLGGIKKDGMFRVGSKTHFSWVEGSKEFVKEPEMSVDRYAHSVCYLKGHIYVLGGSEDSFITTN